MKCKNRHWWSFKACVHKLTRMILLGWLVSSPLSLPWAQEHLHHTWSACLSPVQRRKHILFKDNCVAKQTVLAAICDGIIWEAIPFCNGHILSHHWYASFCLADLITFRLYRLPCPAPWRLPSLFSSQSQIFIQLQAQTASGIKPLILYTENLQYSGCVAARLTRFSDSYLSLSKDLYIFWLTVDLLINLLFILSIWKIEWASDWTLNLWGMHSTQIEFI